MNLRVCYSEQLRIRSSSRLYWSLKIMRILQIWEQIHHPLPEVLMLNTQTVVKWLNKMSEGKLGRWWRKEMERLAKVPPIISNEYFVINLIVADMQGKY
ncbi:hypothetical protein L6164_026448 [Bauhinia variegata]|uniref:Uncharacterized protein n=1 Tax=Bauhinia variegata TaxID=167791 RepID=A0ACB9LR47_BAUVA|nr:hypothetical protein L6164_026448 [Bauhinia variegata]